MKTLTTSQKRQVAIPKEIRETLHIKAGDQLAFRVEKGKIILESTVNIPRSQAWFWTSEVQKKVKKADKNFKEEEIESPEWHKDILKERKMKIEKGDAEYISLEDLKGSCHR